MYFSYFGFMILNVLLYGCRSSTLIFNVMEVESTENVTLVCNMPSSTNLTRWTYLLGSTGTSLMRYQNGRCTVSPSDSFLVDSIRYSYSCNDTINQITVYSTNLGIINNHILTCRDAMQPAGTGLTWIIKIKIDYCTYCETTMTFNVKEITEGDNISLICIVTSSVSYVNWNRNMGANTAAMGVGQNGQCTTQGTTFLDNKSKYSYTCNTTVYQVNISSVQRSEHNDMYMCTQMNQNEGKGSNWIIKVKAPVKSVTLTPSNYLVNVKEYTTIEFTCTTSTARPAAFIYWYIHPNGNSNDISRITGNITTTTDFNDLSVITSTLNFVPTRQHNNMNIYCEAINSVNTSPVKSNMIGLNVQYKAEDPYIVQGKEYRMIENTQGTLSCTVKGGNPTPTLSWSCNNFSPTQQSTINSNGNVTTTLTWTPSRTHEGTCTCTSQQTGFIHKTTVASLMIFYPPSNPIFKVNGTSIFVNISFIEGTTRSITCTSDSKPSPDRYTWTRPFANASPNQSTLTFNTIEKEDAGEYGCIVRNTINSSDEGNVAGINSSTVNIDVLYHPVGLPINNTSILSRKNLTIRCPYTPGMPIETSFVWTRSIDNKQWEGEQLYIPSIEKSDAANYFCYISNYMKPSGESIVYIGNDTQSFHLDVLYEANVTSFTINGIANTTVTTNESDPVYLICNADSNPIASMSLNHDNTLLKTELSNIVKHGIYQSRCLDAGKYVCYAKNEYNTMLSVSKEVQLFVNCHPRNADAILKNFTSEESSTITITLNILAYPPPIFTWYKLVDEEWTLLHDDDNYLLKSSAVQSNLTIRSVGTSDFTSYKVNTKNDFGEMDQLYYLSPYDKPDPPINFTHIETHTTKSSIHLVWTPGSNNGPPQTFNIKYKKSSDNVWKYLSVSDNGESTMDIQLIGLTENTQYVFVIFASNVKGNSPESSITATTLKVMETNKPQSPAPLIGGIAGGVIGCSIIVIFIVFIIRRYPYCKVCSVKLARGKSDKTDDTSDEHDYYNTGRSEEITNQDNNDKAYNTIESDANRNKKSVEYFAYFNVTNVSEYEMINRTNVETTPYSTLDQTVLGTRSSITFPIFIK